MRRAKRLPWFKQPRVTTRGPDGASDVAKEREEDTANTMACFKGHRERALRLWAARGASSVASVPRTARGARVLRPGRRTPSGRGALLLSWRRGACAYTDYV